MKELDFRFTGDMIYQLNLEHCALSIHVSFKNAIGAPLPYGIAPHTIISWLPHVPDQMKFTDSASFSSHHPQAHL